MTKTTIDTHKPKAQLFLNLITAVLIALVVVGAFYKTVFTGSALSRVYQLGQRDTLYAKYFEPQREGYDASVYQYFVPSHVFLTEQLRQGIIPFWNPLVGCGAPFLADVETAALWPWRVFMLYLPPLRSWNLLIIANIMNFALGTFLLAKALNLRRFVIIYASLTCAFCPYLIFQSELIGSSASVIPLVMASFVYAQSSGRFLSKAMAGLASAVMIISGHPEPSFFGIACASALYILLAVLDKEKSASLLKRLFFSLLDISIIGTFSFCFSAFMLLPLFELLKNSDCYKLGLTGHREGVPLNSILVNLIHPAYGNSSPFLGVLAVPLIFSAIWYGFVSDRYVRALSICSLLFLAIMSQVGPLDWVMNTKAFSWFVPKYCWPSLLIMLTMLSAFGFQYLAANLQQNWLRAAKCVTIGSLITIICLLAVHFSPGLLDAIRQDEAFDHMQLIGKYWIRDILLLTVFSIVVAISRFCGKAQAAVCVLAVTFCSIISLMPLVKEASPAGRLFNYDMVEPIPFLEQHHDRMLTMGRHVFCPSSNFCYGINNFVPVNVYHPLRFLNFLVASGVTPEGVNQFFDGRLTAMVDLAAIKYVVTPQPVLSAGEVVAIPSSIKPERTFSWGGKDRLRLVGAGLSLYPQNRELIGTLRFQIPASRARELGVQALLCDEMNNVLWLGDIDRLLYQFSKNPQDQSVLTLTKDLCVPLPISVGKLTLMLQVFDWQNMNFLPIVSKTSAGSSTVSRQVQGNKSKDELSSAEGTMHGAGLLNDRGTAKPLSGDGIKLNIAYCDLSSACLQSPIIENCSVSKAERRFKLCRETKSHVRVYENTHALPSAYLCHDYKLACDEKDSLKILESNSFHAESEAILETGVPQPFNRSELDLLATVRRSENEDKSSQASMREKLVFHRVSCNKISMDVEANSPVLVVLTETFYPGWKASIKQGSVLKEARIMRANYLFQSVLAPAGKSTVIFEFQPTGFIVGLVLLILASSIMLTATVWSCFGRQRKAS